ncbi:MAG: hypothetical protein ACYS8W_09910 [Planctomycetota bacterium]|jgi:hypothetical protein
MTPRGFSQGIEKILVLAKLDEDFRESLISDREAALDECEVELTESEQSILLSIPDEELQSAIKRTRVPDKARRAFLRGATTAVVTGLAVAAIGTCVLLPLTATAGVRVPSLEAHNALREIHHAQELYKEVNSRYGTLEELANEIFQNPKFFSEEETEYTFEVFDITDSGWKARAIPKRKSLKTLYINQSGKVQPSEPKDVGPDSEPLDH